MRLATTDLFKQLTNQQDNILILNQKQLKAVQEVLLLMAEDIVKICEENNLTYHLTGGSALGAKRHQGFIPWDDDIDFDLARKDVVAFLTKFKERYSHKYWLHYSDSGEDYALPSIAIRLKNTIYQGILDKDIKEAGLSIDIAIIENTFNNKILYKLHGILSLAIGLATSCRRFYRDRKHLLHLARNNKEALKIFKAKILIGFFLSFLPYRYWVKLYDYINSLCHNEHSKYVSVPTGRHHYFKETYLRSHFCTSQKLNFASHQWNVPSDIEGYLTHMYKDWQKLPPKHQQEKHVLLKFDLGPYKK